MRMNRCLPLLTLALTLAAVQCPSMLAASSVSDDGSIYIATLDRSEFLIAFLSYGIPCLVCFLLGGWAFWRAQFKLRLLPSVISTLSLRSLSSDVTLEKCLAWLCMLILIVATLPSVFILLWGIQVYLDINHLLGFTLILLLMAAQMSAYAFSHWRVNGWRSDTLVRVLFAGSLLLMWAFELWACYIREPYSYFMLSVVWISFNMLPMVLLTYVVACSITKPLHGYELLDKDPLEDYQHYMQQTLDKQNRKVGHIDPSQPRAEDGQPDQAQVEAPADVSVDVAVDAEEKKEEAASDAPAAQSKVSSMIASIKDASLFASPLFLRISLYLFALILLLVYSLSIALIKDSQGFGSVVGWVTSGAIICLDVTVWLCVYGGKIASPLQACLYQGACRIILIVFGDVYWFVGHSMMYVVLAVFFGRSIVDHILPALTTAQQKTTAVSALLKANDSSADSSSTDESTQVERYSAQLGSSFMTHGHFATTRLGRSLLRYVEFWAFGFLTVAFLADLIVNSQTSTVDLDLTHTQRQYLAGVLAIFLTGVLLSSQIIFRMYANREYRVDWKLLASCALQWAVCCGCGGFLFAMTESAILISLFCYLPPIVYLAAFAYFRWSKNDFFMTLRAPESATAQTLAATDASNNADDKEQSDEEKKDDETKVDIASPSAPAAEEQKSAEDGVANESPVPPTPALNAGALPTPPGPISASAVAPAPPPMMNIKEVDVDLKQYNWLKQYQIAIAALLAAMLTMAMGATIAACTDPPYVGYTIAAVILILASTCIPIVEWFNTFTLSRNMTTQLVLTTVFFLAFILIFWLEGLESVVNNRALALLFLLFMYPCLVVFTFALIKWRDDKWVMSRFVKIALVICCALITAFFIIVAIVFDPWEAGAGLLVLFMLALAGAFFVPILTARFPWLKKWAPLALICCVAAFAIGVASQDGMGFVGFSLAWGMLFLVLVALTYRSHRPSFKNESMLTHIYSPNLFPIFFYDRSPGLRNPLQPDNMRAYLAFSTLLVAGVWGIGAVFFIQTTWIGLGVHAISFVLMFIYICQSITDSRIRLAKAVRFLGEGSDLYKNAVDKAKLAAFRSQLSSVKSASVAPDELANTSKSTKAHNGGQGADNSSSGEVVPASGGDGEIDVESQKPVDGKGSLLEDAAKADVDDLLLTEDDLKVLGLSDPSQPLHDLDWRGLYEVFCKLRRLTPLPSISAFTRGQECQPVTVVWNGHELPRRRCLELLLKMDHHIAQLHLNHLAYVTQLQAEILLAVEALKAQQETEVLTMLRDTGHAFISVEYIRGLKPDDPERQALEHALVEWRATQEKIRLERIRKREEEEAETRRREREEIERRKEEEERLIRIRQEQHQQDEQAARLKQEELRRREDAERRKHEEEQRREELAKQIELERQQREKDEADRKRREQELEAKLEAERNEAELQRLREEREAALVAEEIRRQKEKEQLERLAAERAAHEAELAAQRALQDQVAATVASHVCTLKATGERFVPQRWFQCLTCGSPNGEGCCESCKDICHAGHETKDMGVSPFYCDCGRTQCEGLTGIKPAMKGKPTLESIEREYARTGQRWVDPDFPPDATSLVRDTRGAKMSQWKNLQWMRAEELDSVERPTVFADGTDPNDIKQGNIGDCWLLSALSVMTQRQQDFLNIFISKEHSKAGVYSVNFWKNGERVNVLVDSFFPATSSARAAFASSKDPNELWVMILEKAYAKLHRTYEAIESGFVDQALVDLSGAVGSRIDMTADPYKQQTRNGVLFRQLLAYKQAGFLMGAGTPAGSDSEANASPSGIVQGHAYSLLDVQEVDGHELIRLRNPWGRKEWSGDWSDYSPLWTRRLKAKLGWVAADDGSFWMCMRDFAIHFEDVYVARFFDALNGWHALQPLRGEWAGESAGGCTNFATVEKNPQWTLNITQPTKLVINLAQTDSRGTGQKLKPISVEIYANRGRRVTQRRQGQLVCSNPESYIYRREVSIDQELKPMDEPYTVMISTFNPGEETKWSMQIYATADVELTPCP